MCLLALGGPAGTGGVFFHNSNDLEAGLKQLTEVPECHYVLELPIGDVKRNNALHRLEVKVARSGVGVAARRGYFIPNPTRMLNSPAKFQIFSEPRNPLPR